MATERPGVFGITSAPPREKPRTIPVPVPNIKPASRPEGKPPETKKPLIQRMIGNLGVRIGLGVLAVGGAGYAARETISNNIPAISRPAETIARFDNTKDKGTITAANSIIIDSVEAIKDIPTIPPGDNPKHNINILAPSLNISSDEKINYSKEFSGEGEGNYIYGPSEKEYSIEQDIKDKIWLKAVPEGTIIPAPADGLLEFAAIPRTSPSGTIQSAHLFYKNSDGMLIQLLFGGKPGSLRQLIDAEPFGSDLKQSLDDRKKKFVPVKRGDPIMITLQVTDLSYNGKAWPSGEIGVGSNKTYPVNVNFITLPDGAGQDKLAILAK